MTEIERLAKKDRERVSEREREIEVEMENLSEREAMYHRGNFPERKRRAEGERGKQPKRGLGPKNSLCCYHLQLRMWKRLESLTQHVQVQPLSTRSSYFVVETRWVFRAALSRFNCRRRCWKRPAHH